MGNDTSEAKRFAEPIYLRFEPEMLGDVDAHLAKMKRESPSLQISRSDAVRDLVRRGLRDATRPR